MIDKTPLAETLRPIIEEAVTQALTLEAELRNRQGNTERIASKEDVAAELVGIEAHQLRDARQKRKELVGSLVGKSFVYEHTELLRWLRSRRCHTVADLKRQLKKEKS